MQTKRRGCPAAGYAKGFAGLDLRLAEALAKATTRPGMTNGQVTAMTIKYATTYVGQQCR
jgi:hypothetical protein